MASIQWWNGFIRHFYWFISAEILNIWDNFESFTVYDDPEWQGNYEQYLSELRRGLIGSKDSIRIYFSMKSVLLESKNGMQD